MSVRSSIALTLQKLFTLNDNKTPDLYPLGSLGGLSALIGYTGYSIHGGHPFDPAAFGLGVAAIFGSQGAAKMMDKDPTDFDFDNSGRAKP